jgi:hypothetical protein
MIRNDNDRYVRGLARQRWTGAEGAAVVGKPALRRKGLIIGRDLFRPRREAKREKVVLKNCGETRFGRLIKRKKKKEGVGGGGGGKKNWLPPSLSSDTCTGAQYVMAANCATYEVIKAGVKVRAALGKKVRIGRKRKKRKV